MNNLIKKYAAQVVGCRVNQYELQFLKTQLETLGYVPAQADEKADLCIVNTCAVTESAESSSRHEIRKLLEKHPDSQCIVTGCYAEKDPDSIQAIGKSIQIISNNDKENLIGKIFPGIKIPSGLISSFEGHTRAFVKIQDGCTNFCSYCIIPYLRGPSRSRKKDEILKEVESLLHNSCKEIVITGVNVGDFSDNDYSLGDLLSEIDTLPGLKRLRLSSINPNDIDEKFLKILFRLNHFCPSLHLVLQSGSDTILKKMRRKYTKDLFLQLVERIRSHNSDFCFSTDVIVGFPGETASDFEDTLDIIRSVNFSKVHIFPFSPRQGTQAARLQTPVPSEIIKARKNILSQIADECSQANRERFFSRTVSVLTEQSQDPMWIYGLSPHSLMVKIPRGNLAENTLVQVKIVGSSQEELLGEVVA